jgi:hypothetical protein
MAVTDITTAQWLKDRYLYGVDLTDDNGDPYPDGLYTATIDSAVATVSAEFDIELLGPTKFVERYDTFHQHGISWFLTHLMHKPVITIDKLSVQFANFPQASLPIEWAQIADSNVAQVQLMPGPEALSNTAFSGGIPFVGIQGIMFRDYTPQWWKYEYTAGFEFELAGTVTQTAGGTTLTGADTAFLTPVHGPAKTQFTVRAGDYVKIISATNEGAALTGGPVRVKSVESDTSLTLDSTLNALAFTDGKIRLMQYPGDVLDCIGLIAAMLPLDTAGDLIIGAGISRLNVGVDGLHQEIQTTSGVDNSGYGARIIQYRRRLQDTIAAVKRRYNPIRMLVI